MKKKVFAAISGGVDSSVSAALIKEQGYDVTGVFIKVYQPDFLPCTWKEDRLDAMRVAAVLDIPFLTFDFSHEYKKEVVDYMINEYKKGRTPNPDVMCNKHIKFGSFLKSAKEMGADLVATGHHARLRREFPISNFQFPNNDKVFKNSNIKNSFKIPNSKFQIELLKGVDGNKDQSYFLWMLTQEQLRNTIFPIGEYTKPQVRELARKFNLPTAEKKDSQGLCFIGKLDMKEFLKYYLTAKAGDVLDEKGNIIGRHDGALFYTIGQRHGFTVAANTPHEKAYYVIKKDVNRNTITVSKNKGKHQDSLTGSKIIIEKINWISKGPLSGKNYAGRFRYRQKLEVCCVSKLLNSKAEIVFEKPQSFIPIGQSLVLYDGDICLGGGVIAGSGS